MTANNIGTWRKADRKKSFLSSVLKDDKYSEIVAVNRPVDIVCHMCSKIRPHSHTIKSCGKHLHFCAKCVEQEKE